MSISINNKNVVDGAHSLLYGSARFAHKRGITGAWAQRKFVNQMDIPLGQNRIIPAWLTERDAAPPIMRSLRNLMIRLAYFAELVLGRSYSNSGFTCNEEPTNMTGHIQRKNYGPSTKLFAQRLEHRLIWPGRVEIIPKTGISRRIQRLRHVLGR